MAFLRDKSVYCIPSETLHQTEKYIIGGICLTTSCLGFTGAYLQLKNLWQFRDRQRRTPSANPRILFYLAIADLVACLGIIALAICLMSFKPPIQSGADDLSPYHHWYIPIGAILEIFTLFAYLASYIWTFSYALDMCFQIHGIDCPMVVYHILAWLIPLEIVTCIEVVNYVIYPIKCQIFSFRVYRLSLSNAPIMVILLVNPLLLFITYRKAKSLQRTSGELTTVGRRAIKMCRRKFFWMVFVLTLCWLPNIVSVSYDLAKLKPDQTKKTKLDNLWYLEAFLNPLQGIFNYFVYRNTFRVTATDTRPTNNSLPRVSQLRYHERYDTLQRHAQERSLRRNRYVDSIETPNEESSLLVSSRSVDNSSHSYVSRLLGE